MTVILVQCDVGVFEKGALGNVFAEDADDWDITNRNLDDWDITNRNPDDWDITNGNPDDWDITNKTFTFADRDAHLFFRLKLCLT